MSLSVYENLPAFNYISLLGTPNETTWPGVQTLPDYKPGFPQWSAKEIGSQVQNSNSVSVDLIAVCIS
jgi:cyclin-dependent kinase